jgi:hypothetical protein
MLIACIAQDKPNIIILTDIHPATREPDHRLAKPTTDPHVPKAAEVDLAP